MIALTLSEAEARALWEELRRMRAYRQTYLSPHDKRREQRVHRATGRIVKKLDRIFVPPVGGPHEEDK